MDAMRGRGIHGSGFHAPFYFRFEAWKPTANGRTKVSKAAPPIPPPWFPPLESLFRGAPFPRNAQRGKPILLHRNFGSSVEPLLGERRKPLRGLPFGSRPLQLVIFPSPTANRGPRWPPAAGRCRPLGQRPCGGFGFQGPKNHGPESQRLGDLSPARPCHKAAYVSVHSVGFVAPSAPQVGSHEWTKFQLKGMPKQREKPGLLGAVAWL